MSRDFKEYIHDILERIKRVHEYTQQVNGLDGFESIPLIQDAVIRNLDLIGEAVKNIPIDVRDRYPEIDWRGLAGLRDVLIHQYTGIGIDTIWDIIVNELPSLEKKIGEILQE